MSSGERRGKDTERGRETERERENQRTTPSKTVTLTAVTSLPRLNRPGQKPQNRKDKGYVIREHFIWKKKKERKEKMRPHA